MLEVKKLRKEYGSQVAVADLSFEVGDGVILGFLGPNGAGKSTTMKMICGYIPPTSGTALVNGYDILDEPLEVRKIIGYLPENNPLYLDMYVREYLSFVAQIHHIKGSKKVIEELIEQTGLGRESHKLIGALSKGYRQRVGLAQALIHDPKVLILDEPTSGLDMNQIIDIRHLIKSLGMQKTIILSTHIMQEVEAMCDRVIIINNGRLVADDPIDKLKSRISGDQIISIELDQPWDEKEGFGHIKEISGVRIENNKLYLSVKGNADVRKEIFRTIAGKNHIILEMKREEVGMEDIFQKLTMTNHV